MPACVTTLHTARSMVRADPASVPSREPGRSALGLTGDQGDRTDGARFSGYGVGDENDPTGALRLECQPQQVRVDMLQVRYEAHCRLVVCERCAEQARGALMERA